nr:increased DNA methylation 1 isoform X1 [Ipomoea batatas]
MSIKFLLRCSLKIVKEKRSVNVTGLINCESDDGKETTPSCFPGSGNSTFVVSKDSYCKIEESSGVKKLSEKRLMPSMDIINGPAPKYRKIHFGVVSIGEVIQYWNLKDDSVVKAGVITRNGILCNCCGEVLSISKFKRHVGFKLNHSYLNLFLESVSIGEVIQYRNLKDDSVVKAGVITRNGILCYCYGEVLSISKFKRHAGFKLDHSCVESFPGIWECVRDLINCIEKMLSSFKFEKLVKSAIPSLVKILALGFAFKPLEEEERSSLSNNNLMLFPRTMWLKTYVSRQTS